jgi:hypothetical protein
MSNAFAGQATEHLADGIEQGRSLGSCLQECTFYPEILREMTNVGEQTGSLEETLETIGNYYSGEAEYATAKVWACWSRSRCAWWRDRGLYRNRDVHGDVQHVRRHVNPKAGRAGRAAQNLGSNGAMQPLAPLDIIPIRPHPRGRNTAYYNCIRRCKS